MCDFVMCDRVMLAAAPVFHWIALSPLHFNTGFGPKLRKQQQQENVCVNDAAHVDEGRRVACLAKHYEFYCGASETGVCMTG
jgi:hypothetical protein